ncbi:MAG: AMP-binding protein [Acetobacteraceae bacterium]
MAAERWPDQEAMVVRDQNVRLTYAQLRVHVDRLAAGLIGLGLKPKERIGIWSPNRTEWILTLYAAAKAGLIVVNINPAYRLAELEYALNKVECRALVAADRYRTSDYIGSCGPSPPNSIIARPEHCRPAVCRI